MAAILDFQISISQVFKELQGSNLVFKLISKDLLIGTVFKQIIGGLVWQVYQCSYPNGSNCCRVEIWNLQFPPNILLGLILELWQPSLSLLKDYISAV